MAKIGIIGVGKNGEAFAHKLLPLGHEIFLLNRTSQRAYGVMEDLIDGYPHCRNRIHVCEKYDERLLAADMIFVLVKGDYEYSDFKTLTDLRTKGLPRDGYLLNNVAKKLRGYSGYVIVVSNPVDLNAKQIMLKAGFPPNRIFAYGAQLDTWRGKNRIAEILGISLDPATTNRERLSLFFIGEHGDKAFGLWNTATYNGDPLTSLITDETMTDEVDSYVRKRGVDIILKKFDTTIGTVMPLPETVNWLLDHSKNKIMPFSVFDEKEGIFFGQPISKEKDSIISHLPISLNRKEQDNLEAAIHKIKAGETFAAGLYVDKQIRNILYLDDIAHSLDAVAKGLKIMARQDREFSEFNEIKVHLAQNLSEARDILSKTIGGIDVLITDQRLVGQEMDGISFVKSEVVPNHPYTVPVILSGQANEDDLKSAIGPSFGGYLQKPLDIENPGQWKLLWEAFSRNEERIIE